MLDLKTSDISVYVNDMLIPCFGFDNLAIVSPFFSLEADTLLVN